MIAMNLIAALTAFTPSPAGGGQGWGPTAVEHALTPRPQGPIPTFPQRGKEQQPE